MDPVQKISAWFVANGGFLNPECSIEYREDSGVCVIARSNLCGTQEHAICTSPVQLTLSHLNILSPDDAAYDSRVRHVESDIAKLVGHVSPQVLSYFVLMEQRLLGDASFWEPYISLLPRQDQLTTPSYFTEEDFEWLVGTNITPAYMKRRELWEQDYSRALLVLGEQGVKPNPGYSWELFQWAATIFSSRGFTSSVTLSTLGEAFSILYPVIDILNHASRAKVTWKFDQGNFTIINNQDVAAGEQVYNNYAAKSNEELLMGYGFCIESNPCDEVTVQVPGPPPHIYQRLRALNPEHFKSETWTTSEGTFRLRNGSHYAGTYSNSIPCLQWIPPALLQLTLEVILEHKGEYGVQHLLSTSAPSGHLVLAGVRQIYRPIKNKYDILKRAIDNSPAEPRNSKQRYAKIYRDKQFEILSENCAMIEGTLKKLRAAGLSDTRLQSEPVVVSFHRLIEVLQKTVPPGSDDWFSDYTMAMEALDYDDDSPSIERGNDTAFVLMMYYLRVCMDYVPSTQIPQWLRDAFDNLKQQYPDPKLELLGEEVQGAIDYYGAYIEALAQNFPDTAWTTKVPREVIVWADTIVQDEVWSWTFDAKEVPDLVIYLRPGGARERWLEEDSWTA